MFLFLYILFCLYDTGESCSKSVTRVGGSCSSCTICSGDVVFEDNFDTFQLSKWEHEVTLSGGGNWEFQWYTNNRTNSFTKDGILYIYPTLTADHLGEKALYSKTLSLWGGSPSSSCTDPSYYGCERAGTSGHILNPIKSARIRTLNSFYFTYGRVEVRAKIPIGDWLWPAIWLLPRYNVYGDWPASGEIDILEIRGNEKLIQNGINIGIEQTASTLHWGPSPIMDKQHLTHWTKNNEKGYASDFHVYCMNWTPEGMEFSVDGEEIGSIKPKEGFWKYGNLTESGYSNPWGTSRMAPFDQDFYIIINLAVGGINYFPDDAVNEHGKKPWKNNSPAALTDFWKGKTNWLPTWKGIDSSFQIDYIRVYAI
ncbi:beta-1,3-glucan-binding protein-like [Agrilus planipennis]|uniref:Beta-1,3-glucan-binding protein-like n=1 Tax=Agrilus planipennis TaxID=224129 RepID=A0A1W4X6Z4_AGRPL|nr:beta-1,3-glucan-binding protein-like [Agrilus planipennis]